ncbi:glycerophosphodiester phosphodiesterase family protein [Maribacter sp. LLG6340-A2]|uniref:glycerophosphodiester phosphodiesterase family protein n=1 Tax=Maribacter sp. LLG6340-A2 TaxID=3160834 RepID=UPI00386C6165
MKIYNYIIVLLVVIVSCKNKEAVHHEKKVVKSTMPSIKDKIDNLMDSRNKEVIVVAHRGDWRNAPENSIQAIQNCIDMGVDMVEIDVRQTKDGHLVLMHDATLNRTTTGKGLVSNWTLDSLMTLQLRDGLGVATAHKIPTLKEALMTTKDRILVNLDKSYNIFDQCFEVVKETKTADQVIIKGRKTRAEVEKEFGHYLDKIHFMPVLSVKNGYETIVEDYFKGDAPIAFEFTIAKDTLETKSYFQELRERGSSVWVNSLWPRLNGGHDDEKAAKDINTYQWYIDNGVDIIQTDRPELLLDFLRSKGLHN